MRQPTQTIDDLKTRLDGINEQLKQSELTDDVEQQITADLVRCINDCHNLSTNADSTESTPLHHQRNNDEIDVLIKAAQQSIIDRHVLGANDCMSSKPYVAAISLSTVLTLLWLCFSIYLDITGDKKNLHTNLFVTGVAALLTLLQAGFAVDSIRNMRRISRERGDLGRQLFPNDNTTSYFEQFQNRATDASVNHDAPPISSLPKQQMI